MRTSSLSELRLSGHSSVQKAADALRTSGGFTFSVSSLRSRSGVSRKLSEQRISNSFTLVPERWPSSSLS